MDELRQVVVTGLGGRTARVRVVEEDEDTFYVIGEVEYQRARSAGENVEARLGFPKKDVRPA